MKNIKTSEVKEFVLSHEQSEGFSFSCDAPATLEDTCYALQILRMINIPYPKEKITDFVKTIDMGHLLPKHIYHLLHLEMIETFEIDENIFSNDDIESIFYIAKIAKEINQKIILEKIKKQFSDKWTKPCEELHELCFKVVIMKLSGIGFDEQLFISAINRFQNSDGGFGFREYSTSFLENCYIAIETLSLLKANPENVSQCIRFTMSCQANNGGFGRQSITVPTLESTYYAIKIIEKLSETFI
jgi:hypothetical protein